MAVKDITNLANLLAEHMAANGIGTLGTDLFIQTMPELPRVSTVVVMTGGPIIPEDPTRRPSFQVQHRNTHIESALPKSVQIHNLFDNRWNVLKDFPGRIVAVSEVGSSFKDESGLVIFPLNFAFVTTTQT